MLVLKIYSRISVLNSNLFIGRYYWWGIYQ